MNWLIADAAYAVVWFFMSRWLYGRWRGKLAELGGFGQYCRNCGYSARSLASDQEHVARAVTAALVWPVTLLILLIVLRPPPAAAERAAKEAALKARVSELERDLGIGAG